MKKVASILLALCVHSLIAVPSVSLPKTAMASELGGDTVTDDATPTIDQRPNVLWIIADDLGCEIGCYGYSGVDTPNVDRLAEQGCRYTRAFSTSPVCSSSRSAFQTGRYQTSIGCYHHLTRDKPKLTVPTAVQLMREAGYFVCQGFGTKTDNRKTNAKFGVNYVFDRAQEFDGSDWSQREPGQPFFAQVHIHEPHRPFVRSQRQDRDALIPPYYPEHPITSADWSDYLATVEVMDGKVGGILDRLDSEGITDDTLVLFFGDHGRPHVRDKQWLYDGGLQTPMIVRWPKRLQGGGVESGLVSLLDAMPTTLAAAGIQIPDSLPGQDLLRDDWQGHEALFAARDRCGDAPDRIRSVRTSDFKYIRNFHPERPYLQLSSYKKLSYPVLTLMKVLHERGEWTSPLMADRRPAEELYDLRIDPFEMKNLANDPESAEQLSTMRTMLDQWMVRSSDQGAMDEGQSVDLPALMKSKKAWYEKTMKKRKLSPEISDADYLQWWMTELGVEQ